MLFRSAWMPAPPDGSEPAMDRTRGTSRPVGSPVRTEEAAGRGMERVEDKRHPFAGTSRTGSTGLDLSRPAARHPVSVPTLARAPQPGKRVTTAAAEWTAPQPQESPPRTVHPEIPVDRC